MSINTLFQKYKGYKQIEIYFGIFDEWGGTYYLAKKKFDDLKEYVATLTGHKQVIFEKQYLYYDRALNLQFNHNHELINKCYVKEICTELYHNNKMMIIHKSSEKIEASDVPILNTYTDIKDEKISSLTIDNIEFRFISIPNEEQYVKIIIKDPHLTKLYNVDKLDKLISLF